MFMPSLVLKLLFAIIILLPAANANALNDEGHRIVGVLAMEQTDAKAKAELEEILGSVSWQRIGEACTWPDRVRPTPEWEHTYPWHYINPPPWADYYVEERDCADGDCLPYRLKWAAKRLGDNQLSRTERQHAFNFFCHFMGDVHTPMHNAYGYDKGGNEHVVFYRGEETDLHTFWDHHLIETYHPSWKKFARQLAALMPPKLSGHWTPLLMHAWSDESRGHAKSWMYPPDPRISQDYEQKALLFIDHQLRLAASRMAWVLNSVLGKGITQPTPASGGQPEKD
jgi:hypothetical protein